MTTLHVLRHPDQAAVLFHPVRLQLLRALREPQSAAAVARTLALPRQQANYHLHELEKEGLVAFVEERKRGNCMERILQATAQAFVISTEAMGEPPDSLPADQYSAAYLVASAARLIREVAQVAIGAFSAGKKIATFTLDTEVSFRNAEERAAFAAEMTQAFSQICAKYDASRTPGSRKFRFLLGGYPAITKPLALPPRAAAAFE